MTNWRTRPGLAARALPVLTRPPEPGNPAARRLRVPIARVSSTAS
jgi:hypothetical protein